MFLSFFRGVHLPDCDFSSIVNLETVDPNNGKSSGCHFHCQVREDALTSPFSPFAVLYPLDFPGFNRGSWTGRHGARLDAVNPSWHLTSATPYDPPLTYGGWKQSQALGARIGIILHSREAACDQNAASQRKSSVAAIGDASTENDGQQAPRPLQVKRRRQRLIIHTSPFLRCIETSIGISAGLEQYRGSQNSKSSSSSGKSHSRHQSLRSGSPYLRAMECQNSSHLSVIPEPDEVHAGRSAEFGPHPHNPPKGHLRLDAFLGEWLSPEYFEMITPPPDSKMMVASAKAALLRLKQTEIVSNGTGPTLSRGYFPGGWGSDRSMVNGFAKSSEDERFTDMTGLSHSLPKSNPSKSPSSFGYSLDNNSQRESQSQNFLTSDHGGYTPLQPAFAVSLLGGIPAGYVAHARDACLDIDYPWDSMRPPHDWGDGGVIGEEWSSMHERFRYGLQSMITWYRSCSTGENNTNLDEEAASEDGVHLEDDEEVDTVLVLVTHGAGCNALIGALTNQPVLLDVGMASLTMAVRKARTDTPQIPSDMNSAASQQSVRDSGMSEDYEMKMIASTDHLCMPRHSSGMSRFYAASVAPRTHTSLLRPHSGSVGSNMSSATMLDVVNFRMNGDTSLQPNASTTHNSTGLWTKPVAAIEKKEMFALPPGGPGPLPGPTRSTTPYGFDGNQDTPHQNGGGGLEDHEQQQQQQHLDSFAMQCGLWGSAPQALGTTREKGLKRRWTHSEAPIT